MSDTNSVVVPSQQILQRPSMQRLNSMPVNLPSSAQPSSLASAAPQPITNAAQTVSPTSSSLGLAGYKVIGTIGEGTFGRVHKIQRKEDGLMLVWKELYYGKMNEKEKQQLVSEVNILRDLNHKHIVKYFDRIIDREQKKIYIVMEYCSGGDVASIIKENQRNGTFVEEDFIWKIISELCGALAQCHSACSGVILHRDLKPANIFLDNPQTKCVKLGDFGLARTLKDSFDYARTHVGTPYYMSPEQVMELQYNEKSDMWSLGCLIYEIAALSPPFKAQSHLALATKIRAGVFERIPRHYSNELDRLIRMLIQVDQAKRPSIEIIQRMVNERNERIEREKEAANEAAHRRRNSMGNLSNLNLGAAAQLGAATGTSATTSSTAALNLQLAQREAELTAQATSLAKRLEECTRREAALEARERRVKDRESQLDKREMKLMTLQANQKPLYRLPLTNIANFTTNSTQPMPPYPSTSKIIGTER